MAELKTKATTQSISDFLQKVEPEEKRQDCFKLVEIMEDITGEKAVLWGSSIIGFGSYHYKSERSSQEGDWPLTGFSPRKQNVSIYIMSGFEGSEKLLDALGKHKHSVSCLYVKRLADIDLSVLKKLIKNSVVEMKKRDVR